MHNFSSYPFHRLHLLARGYALQWQRLWRRSGGWRDLMVFETSVGVKYKNSRFHSDYFGRYPAKTLDFSAANLSWADLVLSPDLLKNQFTSCGKTVPESPHVQLIAEFERGAVPAAYMKRVRTGTLDARLPGWTSEAYLRQCYQDRLEALSRNEVLSVYVTPVRWKGERKLMIVDGKHRAALVAQLNRPEALRLTIISNEFSQDPFFATIYSYVLSLKADDYRINQEMIQAVLYES